MIVSDTSYYHLVCFLIGMMFVVRCIQIHCGVELPTIFQVHELVQVTTSCFFISAYHPSAFTEEFLPNKEAASF